MLLQDTSPLSQEQRELLSVLDAGAAHVVIIVEDSECMLRVQACLPREGLTLTPPAVLLHGALSSGNFPVVWEPLTLMTSVIVPALTTLTLQPALEEKLQRITLTHSVAPDVPPVLLGDATRLVQVLTNLLNNSCKFSSAGGAIDLRVDVLDTAPPGASAQAARWLRLQVSDTGIGIDPCAYTGFPA